MAPPTPPMSEAGASVFALPGATLALPASRTKPQKPCEASARDAARRCFTNARAFHRAHRPAAALSHRHRGAAGMGLYRRAAGAAERVSRRGLAAFEKEQAPRS